MGVLRPWINGVHVLPFHPSSSDGGFSVEDYDLVDPAVGTWPDIERLGASHRLMVDAVVNHVSAQGTWFRAHLAGAPEQRGFFRVVDPGTDLSSVVRPRPGPPTTPFTRADGSSADYWTTFSADQVDLDYRSPEVLLAVFAAVFTYIARGASAVRLDAVAYLWKDPATTSIHRPETHAIVALLRDCVDEIDPNVVLVTETNVPHADNVAYLGSGAAPEAHAVYQFSLAPLVLHAVQTGGVAPLRAWARSLTPVPATTALNFLGSHDGVGVRPAAGWLDADQIHGLADRCRAAGGAVNEAMAPDGTPEPYELAATWAALCGQGDGGPFQDDALVDRHLATHSVAFALQGIPLVYVHSLVASPNATERAARSGVTRDLNRARFATVAEFMNNAGGPVWRGLRQMLGWRRGHGAFHPDEPQLVWDNPGTTFVVERGGSGGPRALVLTNLGVEPETVAIGPGWCLFDSDREVPESVTLGPWGRLWLQTVSAG